jgi:hypothetical protein
MKRYASNRATEEELRSVHRSHSLSRVTGGGVAMGRMVATTPGGRQAESGEGGGDDRLECRAGGAAVVVRHSGRRPERRMRDAARS